MGEEYVIRCGALTIADGDPQELGIVEELSFDGSQVSETALRINASAPKHFDRITKTKEIRCTVFREHASYSDAMDFAARHDEELPAVADFILELTEGGNVMTLTSEDSLWEAVTQDPIGVATVTEYRVQRGGLFTREDTEAEAPPVIDAGTGYFAGGGALIIDAGDYAELTP